MIRCSHRKREFSLEVRLLEVRVHLASVGAFELRVQVGLAINRINEAVETSSVTRVLASGVDNQRVVSRKICERDSAVVEQVEIEGLAVQCEFRQGLCDEIDPRARTRRCTERHSRSASKRCRIADLAEVENNVVVVDVEESGATRCFQFGQILSWHGDSLNCLVPSCHGRQALTVHRPAIARGGSVAEGAVMSE